MGDRGEEQLGSHCKNNHYITLLCLEFVVIVKVEVSESR